MLNIISTFVSYFLNGLKLIVGVLFFRVMSALGLSFITYKAVLPEVKSYLAGFINQLPEQGVQMIGVLGVDIAMVMIVSALVVRVGSKTILKSIIPPVTQP
jgi:Protein of unknown function (DUF2523)